MSDTSQSINQKQPPPLLPTQPPQPPSLPSQPPPPPSLPSQPPALPPLNPTQLEPSAGSEGSVCSNRVGAASGTDRGTRTPPRVIVASDRGSAASSLTRDVNYASANRKRPPSPTTTTNVAARKSHPTKKSFPNFSKPHTAMTTPSCRATIQKIGCDKKRRWLQESLF